MRTFKIILFLFIALMLIGCKKDKYIECKIDINNPDQGYTLNGVYKIYHKKNFVTRIEKSETYISNDKERLKFLKESNKLIYYNLSDRYGGVIYNIKEEDSKLVINSSIDLKDFDLNTMARDGKIEKDYVISGKLALGGITRYYESKGAVCEDI